MFSSCWYLFWAHRKCKQTRHRALCVFMVMFLHRCLCLAVWRCCPQLLKQHLFELNQNMSLLTYALFCFWNPVLLCTGTEVLFSLSSSTVLKDRCIWWSSWVPSNSEHSVILQFVWSVVFIRRVSDLQIRSYFCAPHVLQVPGMC